MIYATFKLVMAIGVLLNSALYLTGCVAAGLIVGNPLAWRMGLAAAGATYLSYICHFASEGNDWHGAWARVLVYTSILLGAFAGISLLW